MIEALATWYRREIKPYLDNPEQARRCLRWWWHFRPIIQRDRATLARARRENPPSGAEDPLVTVVIPTFNRAELLTTRAVPSVLNQTYENLEIYVIGDHCKDDTAERMDQFDDPRLTFINLDQRGDYPDDPELRWMVAGTVPIREGILRARGEWIAICNDDEQFTPDHVEVLLREGQQTNAELVSGISLWEMPIGPFYRGMPLRAWGAHKPNLYGLRMSLIAATLYRTHIVQTILPMIHEPASVGMAGDRHETWRLYQAGVRDAFVHQVVTEAPMRPGATGADGGTSPLAPDRQQQEIINSQSGG